MKCLYSILLCFLSCSLAVGQTVLEPPPPVKPIQHRWAYDSFSSIDLETGEEHSYFSIVYKLNPTLHTELRGFYDTYRVADVMDFSLRVKWYPSKKFYVFSGVGVQAQRAKVGKLPIMPIRMLNGVGYDVHKNISIEAVHDLNFSSDKGMPNLTALKGKYRF